VKRKAQVKFGETFAIIILVYIILMIGMIWYNNINTKAINEMSEESLKERSFEKYYYIMNSDLLHKTEQGDVDEEFDLAALRAFSNYSTGNQKEYIRKQLGEALVTVKLYDKDLDEIEDEIILYNNTYNPNLNSKIKNEVVFKALIPVVDAVEKRTSLGILSVIIYG
jgi:hypothetical protein